MNVQLFHSIVSDEAGNLRVFRWILVAETMSDTATHRDKSREGCFQSFEASASCIRIATACGKGNAIEAAVQVWSAVSSA